MDLNKIGKFISFNRKKIGLTQEDLGRKVGVTGKTVSRWENGNYMPDLSLLIPLSEILSVTLNELLLGEKIENENKVLEKSIVNTIEYSNKKIINKNKIIKLLLFICVLLIFTFSVLFIIDVNRMKNNKKVFFSTWGFKYAPPIDLNENKINNTIKNYLLNKNEETKKEKNEKWFICNQNLLIEENNKTTTVFTWVLEESYYEKNKEIIKNSASSIPYKFVLEKENDEYKVISLEFPKFTLDSEKIFPKEVLKKIDKVYYDGTYELLQLCIDEQVNYYYNGNY